MSGSKLSPLFSSELASNVYLIKNADSREGFTLKYKNHFNFDGSSFTQGKTGGYVVNKKHIMVLLTTGKGIYEGQAFVAIKGTASLYDALTDLNTGLKTGHTGFPVHQGFYYAFDSMITELRQFVSRLKGISVVHCVGHSLGGAVATLVADWLKKNKSIPSVKLYTFGSPRVGLESFASKCTSNLQGDIYRVYHKTDPVPMVPTWPFYDVPYNDVGYLLYSPVAVLPPWKYHFMEHYVASAKAAGSWDGMIKTRPTSYMDHAIEKWLKSDSFVSFSAATLELLNASLLYVVKKITNVAGIAMVGAASASLTFLDRMAMLLAKGAKISSDLTSWVFYLVKKMASLIGVKIKEGMDLTLEFIRSVFMRVHKRISDMIFRIGQEI